MIDGLPRSLSQKIRAAGAPRDESQFLINVLCVSQNEITVARGFDVIRLVSMILMITPRVNKRVEVGGKSVLRSGGSLRWIVRPRGRHKIRVFNKGQRRLCFRDCSII